MENTENNLIMDVLAQALPGRSQDQVLPFGLVYAGMRWGRDSRHGQVPLNEQGHPMNGCRSSEDYHFYVRWLADHLSTLEAQPSKEQTGLCIYLDRMLPEDAVLMLGMNVALYQSDTEGMETWIEEGEPFEAFFANWMENWPEEDEERPDEAVIREEYAQVAREMEEKQRCCPDVRHADVGYRVPLSRILRRFVELEERVRLVDAFYQSYNDYISK
ncbi:hypothetical protein [Desulfonatronum thiodismutans]|uniref:hypothetical protein n=1 Tax=Desulfonatronum thiodismutans TaxID=159290 RepID=UPI0012683783|nr:hypothetical protein [Desulfonatronum thiodismutans]